MSHDHAHGHTYLDLLGELAQQFQPIFTSSKQAIYIYFDDDHKVCNEKFASLLGYGSAKEWAEMEGSFPSLFIDAKSQETLIDAYQAAMQNMVASTTKVQWKKKSGESIDTTVILVPLSYKGHLFALHFVS